MGQVFAGRADQTTDEDRFVADNFAPLKTSALVEAGVPREFGGGRADVDELAAMLRTLAYHCGSTALAFSMHTHQVAVPAWRWTHQKVAAVEPLLKRIAAERIFLLSSGGSDWIAGSGWAERSMAATASPRAGVAYLTVPAASAPQGKSRGEALTV